MEAAEEKLADALKRMEFLGRDHPVSFDSFRGSDLKHGGHMCHGACDCEEVMSSHFAAIGLGLAHACIYRRRNRSTCVVSICM